MYRKGPAQEPYEGCFGQNRRLARRDGVEAKRELIDTLGRRSGNHPRELLEKSV
jgi:hypothetical protein